MAELIQNAGYQDFTLETLKTPDGVSRLNGIIRQLAQNISSDGESVRIFQGYGTPEASVAAGIGSLYMRVDGGADTSVYRKESGSGNTGWVAIKAPATLPLTVANGGTGSDLSATAQGSILYFSATGVVSVLAPGTAGQFLTTQGAAANPTWTGTSYTAGDYPLNAIPIGNLDLSNGSATYTKLFEGVVPITGTIRTKYWAYGDAAFTMYSRIYRNGSAVGTENTTSSTVGVEFSEDIAGWTSGDLIQIYAKYPAADGPLSFAGGLRLYTNTPTIGASGFSTTAFPYEYRMSSAPTSLTGIGVIGDRVTNTSGGASTTLYIKTAAGTWTAK